LTLEQLLTLIHAVLPYFVQYFQASTSSRHLCVLDPKSPHTRPRQALSPPSVSPQDDLELGSHLVPGLTVPHPLQGLGGDPQKATVSYSEVIISPPWPCFAAVLLIPEVVRKVASCVTTQTETSCCPFVFPT
jgi:hypothetical protein